MSDNEFVVERFALGMASDAMQAAVRCEQLADRWAGWRQVLTAREAAHELRVALYGEEIADEYRRQQGGDL
ncbi:hypothetical protein [Nocardia aurea]|uniref:hypothetical protein n=1 Tax=Nocardia aurea TaxID=2144174 RepID=UPI00339F3D50